MGMLDYGKPEDYPEWLIEDIEDAIISLKNEDKNFSTSKDLKEYAKELRWESQRMYEESMYLENQSSIYEKIAHDWEVGYNWFEMIKE